MMRTIQQQPLFIVSFLLGLFGRFYRIGDNIFMLDVMTGVGRQDI